MFDEHGNNAVVITILILVLFCLLFFVDHSHKEIDLLDVLIDKLSNDIEVGDCK